LELINFKSEQCQQKNQHNHKHCPKYHNSKDKKRAGNFWSVELCEFAEKGDGICPNGEYCKKAHNRVEQLYKPDKYKTKFCSFYPDNLDKCEYGPFCSFAHSESDITIELIHLLKRDEDFYIFHFKTQWCPFNLTKHDKASCVYAHNWQDYRRKPHIFPYEPVPCPNWKSTDFIVNYLDGCPNYTACTKCHGWKECEYHPLNYKTKPCKQMDRCKRGVDCPYFHNPYQRRVVE